MVVLVTVVFRGHFGLSKISEKSKILVANRKNIEKFFFSKIYPRDLPRKRGKQNFSPAKMAAENLGRFSISNLTVTFKNKLRDHFEIVDFCYF